MSSNKAVSGKEVVKFLESLGFAVARTTGSHHQMKKEGHPLLVTVPIHANQCLKKGLLNSILSAAGSSREALQEWLDR
jgi:predicted RNA binding protein YcfA (HicA-like mRNA interferase family)